MRVLIVVGALAACGPKAPPANPTQPPAETPAVVADGAKDGLEYWVAKLESFENEGELLRAVTELERLGDPAAIAPLGSAWEKNNRNTHVLRAIVALALKPEFGDKKGPFIQDALPALITALAEVDADRRTIDDAVLAADALGLSRHPKALAPLVGAATKKTPRLSPQSIVRVAAIRALQGFKDDDAVTALISIAEADTESQDMRIHAAAIDSLGVIGDKRAINPLIVAAYRIPPLHNQIRRALTRLGPSAVEVLLEAFAGEHEELNKLAKHNNASGGQLRFKAAALLADFVATQAAPILAKQLARPAEVSFVDNSGSDGPLDHAAILAALAVVGSDKQAPAVLRVAKARKTTDEIRLIAVDVYSVLAPRRSNLTLLRRAVSGKLGGASLDDDFRILAARSFGRLAGTPADLEVLERLGGEATKANNELVASALTLHRTTARVGIECQSKVDCYVEFLKLTSDGIAKRLGVPIEDKDLHKKAAVDRALTELGKMGPKAKAAIPTLLDIASSTDRVVRLPALFALVRIADRNCQACRERLDAILRVDLQDRTLAALEADTRVIYHYFLNGVR